MRRRHAAHKRRGATVHEGRLRREAVRGGHRALAAKGAATVGGRVTRVEGLEVAFVDEGRRLLEHLLVQVELKLAGAERSELSEHDVLGDTAHVVGLRVHGGLHQHVDRLLEGAAHERARVDAVDAMARDGEQVAAEGHHIAQDGKVAVVDVRAVKLDDGAQLLKKRLAHGLDAEHADRLDDVRRLDAVRVDPLVGAHDGHEIDALGVEAPLRDRLARASFLVDKLALGLAHEDAQDALDAAQSELREHVALKLLEEHVVLFVLAAAAYVHVHVLLEAAAIRYEAHAHDEPVGVVVVADDVQHVGAVRPQQFHRDVLHGQVFVAHRLAVELDAQAPWRDLGDVDLLVRHLVVGAHKLLVLLHQRRLLGVGGHDRIVPDLRALGDRAQRRVLEQRLHRLRGLRVVLELGLEVDRQRGRLRELGDVNDLLQARHAARHVRLGRDSRVVEGVEGHLGGGLADGLCRQRADHLARADAVLQEALLDLAQQPLEGSLRQVVLGEHALRGECRANEREEVERRVPLRLDREAVGALDDLELGQQLAHLLDNLLGGERARLALVHLVVHLRQLDQARQVDADGWLGLALWEGAVPRVRERDPVVFELLELLAQQLLGLGITLDLLGQPGAQPRLAVGPLLVPAIVRRGHVVLKHRLEGTLFGADVRQLGRLERDGVHAVLTVEELEHLAARVAHGAIVLDHHILHRLDEAALDVAGLGGLHSGIDQTLAATHRVEEKLLRGEAAQVRVLDEATRLRAVVVLCEVRQRPVEEAVGDALTLDVLLPDAGDHLRNVDERALRAGDDHVLDVVGFAERLLRAGARRVTRLVEHLVDDLLEGLEHRVAGLALEFARLGALDDRLHLLLGGVDGGDDVVHRLGVGDRVANANREGPIDDPVVDDALVAAKERPCAARAKLVVGDVDDAAGGGAERLLVEHPREVLATVDDDARVADGEFVVLVVWVAVRVLEEVDLGQVERHNLLARPQLPRLQDRRDRQRARERVEVHHKVHHEILVEEVVALGERARA